VVRLLACMCQNKLWPVVDVLNADLSSSLALTNFGIANFGTQCSVIE